MGLPTSSGWECCETVGCHRTKLGSGSENDPTTLPISEKWFICYGFFRLNRNKVLTGHYWGPLITGSQSLRYLLYARSGEGQPQEILPPQSSSPITHTSPLHKRRRGRSVFSLHPSAPKEGPGLNQIASTYSITHYSSCTYIGQSTLIIIIKFKSLFSDRKSK